MVSFDRAECRFNGTAMPHPLHASNHWTGGRRERTRNPLQQATAFDFVVHHSSTTSSLEMQFISSVLRTSQSSGRARSRWFEQLSLVFIKCLTQARSCVSREMSWSSDSSNLSRTDPNISAADWAWEFQLLVWFIPKMCETRINQECRCWSCWHKLLIMKTPPFLLCFKVKIN